MGVIRKSGIIFSTQQEPDNLSLDWSFSGQFQLIPVIIVFKFSMKFYNSGIKKFLVS